MENYGPYRVVRRIAMGGMAEVFLARQLGIEGLERTVVLKRIHSEFSTDPEFVTMFLDEARLMASLSHPHIAQVFDLGKVGADYFLVMEYVHGPTLETVMQNLRGATLPEPVLLGIILQIAEALAYLHELHDEFGRPLQIVHRDLNPANVIVGYNGGAKLIDFGIAKTAIKVYETRQGVVKGTFGYMAPEQHQGVPVDHRADLYSLAVLLYELATGTLPFGPPEGPGALERMRKKQYRPPGEVNPHFGSGLEPLLSWCLEPTPDARPQGMRVFIQELSRYLSERQYNPTLGMIGAAMETVYPDPHRAAMPLRHVSTWEASDEPPENTVTVRQPLADLGGDFPGPDGTVPRGRPLREEEEEDDPTAQDGRAYAPPPRTAPEETARHPATGGSPLTPLRIVGIILLFVVGVGIGFLFSPGL